MMKSNQSKYWFFSLLFLIGISISIQSQSKKQHELENRRQELQQEMKQLNTLLFQGKKEQKSVLSQVEDLDYKVTVRQNLISITNQQANLLTREINNNQKGITKLRDKLKLLKEEYAAMIVKSYKSKSEQSKVMFLLSSNNFQQAYKRLEYIKQYADYQKKQGEEIKEKTIELQELNKELLEQKRNKQKLIDENRLAKNKLQKELIAIQGKIDISNGNNRKLIPLNRQFANKKVEMENTLKTIYNLGEGDSLIPSISEMYATN